MSLNPGNERIDFIRRKPELPVLRRNPLLKDSGSREMPGQTAQLKIERIKNASRSQEINVQIIRLKKQRFAGMQFDFP